MISGRFFYIVIHRNDTRISLAYSWASSSTSTWSIWSWCGWTSSSSSAPPIRDRYKHTNNYTMLSLYSVCPRSLVHFISVFPIWKWTRSLGHTVEIISNLTFKSWGKNEWACSIILEPSIWVIRHKKFNERMFIQYIFDLKELLSRTIYISKISMICI